MFLGCSDFTGTSIPSVFLPRKKGWIHEDPIPHLRHVTAAGLLSASCGSTPKIIEDLQSLAGWWLTYPSEKYELVKVSWDDYIPNIWKNIKVMFQTTNQDSIFHFKGRTHRLIEIVMMNQWME